MVSWFKYSALLLLPSLISWGETDDCPKIRLDQGANVFTDMPVFNQDDYARPGDENICYAVASALAIDACRFRKSGHLDKYSSPWSIALNYKLTDPDDYQMESVRTSQVLWAIGDENTAISSSRRRPICDQKFLDKFMGGLKNRPSLRYMAGHFSDGIGADNFFRSTLELVNNYSQLKKGIQAPPLPLNSYWCGLVEKQTIDIESLRSGVEAALDSTDPRDRIAGFVDKLCAGHSFTENCPAPLMENRAQVPIPPAPRDEKQLSEWTNQSLIHQLHDLLQSKPAIPPVIAYLPRIFHEPGYEGIKDNPANRNFSFGPGSHASVVVGQERDPTTHRCGFWIRNSYGPECKRAGKPIYQVPCENGTLFVDADSLAKNLKAINWIPNQ